MLAARRASSSSGAGVPLPAAEQQQQLSLGDIVVLGRSKSIKGKIRCGRVDV
jgi:hypothetical protein